jgi:hypothetical protein
MDSDHYLAQAHPTHSQPAPQVQVSPLQSGHLQTLQPQPACAVGLSAEAQHDPALGAADAVRQPQSPQEQSSQLQFTPSQFGH